MTADDVCISDWSSDVCSSDLVSIGDAGASYLFDRLFGSQHSFDRKVAQPRDCGSRSFNAVRISDGSAQHLISAADAQDMPAPPHMGGVVDVPTFRAQELQIGNGSFSAGPTYERSAARDRLSWGNHGEPDGCPLRQRVEI